MVPYFFGNKILTAGDSISAQGYFAVGSGVGDQLTAGLVPYSGSYTAVSSGVAAKSSGVAAQAGGPVQVPRGTFPHGSIGTIINTGVPGQRSAGLAADVTNQITSHNPDVVIILIGINDASGFIAASVYGANVQSIVTQVRAWSSTVPIGLVSVLTFGDAWVVGPPPAFYSEGGDQLLLDYCAQLQTIAANNTGVTYIPARDGMLAWEEANNAPAPGVEGTLFNERHPTIPLGQVQLGTAMTPYFQAMP